LTVGGWSSAWTPGAAQAATPLATGLRLGYSCRRRAGWSVEALHIRARTANAGPLFAAISRLDAVHTSIPAFTTQSPETCGARLASRQQAGTRIALLRYPALSLHAWSHNHLQDSRSGRGLCMLAFQRSIRSLGFSRVAPLMCWCK